MDQDFAVAARPQGGAAARKNAFIDLSNDDDPHDDSHDYIPGGRNHKRKPNNDSPTRKTAKKTVNRPQNKRKQKRNIDLDENNHLSSEQPTNHDENGGKSGKNLKIIEQQQPIAEPAHDDEGFTLVESKKKKKKKNVVQLQPVAESVQDEIAFKQNIDLVGQHQPAQADEALTLVQSKRKGKKIKNEQHQQIAEIPQDVGGFTQNVEIAGQPQPAAEPAQVDEAFIPVQSKKRGKSIKIVEHQQPRGKQTQYKPGGQMYPKPVSNWNRGGKKKDKPADLQLYGRSMAFPIESVYKNKGEYSAQTAQLASH